MKVLNFKYDSLIVVFENEELEEFDNSNTDLIKWLQEVIEEAYLEWKQ